MDRSRRSTLPQTNDSDKIGDARHYPNPFDVQCLQASMSSCPGIVGQNSNGKEHEELRTGYFVAISSLACCPFGRSSRALQIGQLP